MAESDPYSRHYWRLVDDPRFADVYTNDHHYATWSRLLMIADQAWPATAHLPVSARRSSVARLAAVGLLDLLPGGRFKMHGTDAERRKRSQSASNAATMRWQENRSADRSAETMPSKAKHSKAETSIPRARDDTTGGLSDDEGEVFSAMARAGAFIRPESGMGQRVVGLIARQGAESVTAALERLVKSAGRQLSDRQVVFGVEQALDAIPSAKEARAQDSTDEARKRGERVQDKAHERRVEAFRWTGKWDEAFGQEPEWRAEWGKRKP